jgi:SAM-dependent methyltransferase
LEDAIMKSQSTNDTVRRAVRETYSRIATSTDRCGCSPSSLGYSADELAALPAGADMGLGSGNPEAIAALRPGETVLDLGSGGGIDCFIAARRVGEAGRVIGVDMTPEMVEKARRDAGQGGYGNVEFRLGEIEHLPVADASVDVVLSNCVINLSPDKAAVYGEAFRVLRPGGRLAISDIVAAAELPDEARNDIALRARCVSGAATVADLEGMLREAGFDSIRIRARDEDGDLVRAWSPGARAEDFVVAATIEAQKPGA